jgi:hypothetical protein
MQRRFPTIRDYHQRAPEIEVQNADWGAVRASVRIEGSGGIRFAHVDHNALVLTLDGTERHLIRMDGIDDATPSRPGDICIIPRGVDLHLAWTNRHALQRTPMVEFDDAIFASYAYEVLSDTFSCGHLIASNFAQRPMPEPPVRLVSHEVWGTSGAGGCSARRWSAPRQRPQGPASSRSANRPQPLAGHRRRAIRAGSARP